MANNEYGNNLRSPTRAAEGWKYKTKQKVFLKGTKNSGLEMDDIIEKHEPPWHEGISGVIDQYLGNIHSPAYSVRIDPRWRHFFAYRGVSLSENDIYIEGEAGINHLDEGLFEL